MHGHSSPRTAFSTSTSAGQEDHVSMGSTACWNLLQSCHRLSEVLACELLISCQALENISESPSNYVSTLKSLVRAKSPKITEDRTTSDDLKNISNELRQGNWLARIEAENNRISRI